MPEMNLTKWREDPNLHPQQFSADQLYPHLKDFVTPNSPLQGTPEYDHINEEPTKPSFPYTRPNNQPNLNFQTDDPDRINNAFKRPSIGLETDIRY